MTASAKPSLKPGRTYRTRQFASRTSNPTRLMEQFVREGKLQKLQGGLYLAPAFSRWGVLPSDPVDLLNTWLEGRQNEDWVFTGSEVWNTLGLGSTAVHAARRVYNRKRSGPFDLGGHRFHMHKVPFPKNPPAEWFVVDLLNHTRFAAVDQEEVWARLTEAVVEGRFHAVRLLDLARRYGRKATQEGVEKAVEAVEAVVP